MLNAFKYGSALNRRRFSTAVSSEEAFENFVAAAKKVSSLFIGDKFFVKDDEKFNSLDKSTQAKLFFWSVEENEAIYQECKNAVVPQLGAITEKDRAIAEAKQAYDAFLNAELSTEEGYEVATTYKANRA